MHSSLNKNLNMGLDNVSLHNNMDNQLQTIDLNPPEDVDIPLLSLYENLIFPRMIEEKMLKLLRQGRLSKWFSGIGQEAIAVGVSVALSPNDYILPMHRNLGVFTVRNLDLVKLLCQLMGKGEGYTKGRERSFHFGTKEHKIVGMISHLASMLPVACGLALSFKLKNAKDVAVAFTGDGSTSEGDFHEALNLAAVWKLPVIFVVENNQYALSTPVFEQYACKNLSDRALGYGMIGETVDGNDIIAVYRAMKKAIINARNGMGPTLLEFITFRMRGHEEASGTSYVPQELFDIWAKKDPIICFEEKLFKWNILSHEIKESIKERLKKEIDTAVDVALEEKDPDNKEEIELADVYAKADYNIILPKDDAVKTQMRYIDAISNALDLAMQKDPSVLIIGQDIAEYGGAFKVTQGFLEKFGKERVRNTPIIESGAIGCAIGLALDGFKPVVEMQFADFVSCGFNQIVNNLAKTHYRWNASLPVVIRLPSGGGTGAGPFHSQNPEAWFCQVAGLKVVAPSNAYDAKGLLLSAINDPNPVLFLEHKFLYRSVKSDIPSDLYHVEIGKSFIAKNGTDATIITYGIGVHWALDIANILEKEGHFIEVIDLRTLIPLDVESILNSVRKTSRALILHEAPLTGGFGGEIASIISEKAFEYLDAPVMRVGSLDTPVPFSKKLEERFSAKHRLLDSMRYLLKY